MTTSEETRKTVLGYFNAWTTHKTDEAYAFLADDLAFWGPTASYASAEEFRPGLIQFAAMTKRAQITRLLVDGDWAAMNYDCELPAPIGTIRIASFFRVERGKIKQYETMFDATAFRKAGG
jgi:SnoaL-like domain